MRSPRLGDPERRRQRRSLSGLQLLEVVGSDRAPRPRLELVDRAPIRPHFPASNSANRHARDTDGVRYGGVIKLAFRHVVGEVHVDLVR